MTDSNSLNGNEQLNTVKKNAYRYLAGFLMCVAVLNVIEILIKAVIRYFYSGQEGMIGGLEGFTGMFRFVIVTGVFLMSAIRCKREQGAKAISLKLIRIWGIILIPIQIINYLVVMLYTRMLEIVEYVLVNSENDADGQIYAMIYDSTHGFKYICIFIAILLGVMITGEIVEKRVLVVVSILIAILFMMAFTLLRMQSFSMESVINLNLGINWTSMIYHALNTLGLFLLGVFVLRLNEQE